MMDENELLFDELYEKTKDFGRTQFVRLLMAKERENKELKRKLNEAIHKATEFESEVYELKQENQKYKEVIEKAREYMKDFIFEPLLTNEDRKLIMYNDNLRNFEKILKEVE